MFYLAIGKDAYYLSLDYWDASLKGKKIKAAKPVYPCVSINQAKKLIALALERSSSRLYCKLPLTLNAPTSFIASGGHVYLDPQPDWLWDIKDAEDIINYNKSKAIVFKMKDFSPWCWSFDEISSTSTLLYNASIYCQFDNNTCYDSLSSEMQLALDDNGKLAFYDFQARILYLVRPDSSWFSLSSDHTLSKLSKKPKLSRPTYTIDRHFIKTTTE